MKAWVKGGLWGILVWVISLLLYGIVAFTGIGSDCDGIHNCELNSFMYLTYPFMLGPWQCVSLTNPLVAEGTIGCLFLLGPILGLIEFFIIGALIGLIISKIKSKNKSI